MTEGRNVKLAHIPSFRPSVASSRFSSDMRLILFDIDGTLLWTNGAGRRAVGAALRDETGSTGPIDTYRLDGKTDPLIVRELLELSGHPDPADPRRIASVCERYVLRLEEELRDNNNARLLPGVPELLRALEPAERDGRAMVGLLTGNLERGAVLKLRAAGLEPSRFRVGAYGSDSGVRSDLPAIAAERARRLAAREFAGASVVILGDTPADVECGRPIGARAIGVATGHYDVAALQRAGAAAVLADLADTVAALQAIFA
jgi:phosphoglycolate phosphatase-like HAD superfamily hydrolase